jgi:hypothetical protein
VQYFTTYYAAKRGTALPRAGEYPSQRGRGCVRLWHPTLPLAQPFTARSPPPPHTSNNLRSYTHHHGRS